MTLLNVSLGFISESIYNVEFTNYETENTISNYVNDELDFGYIGGSVVTGLLWVVSVFFSLFGINFIAVISLLPLWLTTLFLLLNTITAFSIIMYFVDRIWIG